MQLVGSLRKKSRCHVPSFSSNHFLSLLFHNLSSFSSIFVYTTLFFIFRSFCRRTPDKRVRLLFSPHPRPAFCIPRVAYTRRLVSTFLLALLFASVSRTSDFSQEGERDHRHATPATRWVGSGWMEKSSVLSVISNDVWTSQTWRNEVRKNIVVRIKLSYVAADNRFSANQLERDARNCRFSLSLPFICNLQTYGRLSSGVQSIGFTKHG